MKQMSSSLALTAALLFNLLFATIIDAKAQGPKDGPTKQETIDFILEKLPQICGDGSKLYGKMGDYAGKLLRINEYRCDKKGFAYNDKQEAITFTVLVNDSPRGFQEMQSYIDLKSRSTFILVANPAIVEFGSLNTTIREKPTWYIAERDKNGGDHQPIIYVNDKDVGERVVKALNYLPKFFKPDPF